MKKYIFLATLALILATATTSCLRDTGTYDYRVLPPIEISNLVEAISQPRLSQLVLNPVVTQNGSDGNLTFEWRLRDDLSVPDPLLGYFINRVIGTSADLDFLLDVPSRRYHLALYVTDQTTGLIVSHRISLNVESLVSPGLMVFHGSSTSGDVSIVANPLINAIIPGFTEDFVRHNVFSENNGRRTGGAPAAILHGTGAGLNFVYVFVKGETGGYKLSVNDMTILGDYNSLFREPPATVNFQAVNMWNGGNRIVIMNDGNLHVSAQSDPALFTPFSIASFGRDIQPAPFVGVGTGSIGGFYCTLSRRFMWVNNGAEINLYFDGPAASAFNPNNVDKEVVFSETGILNRWYVMMQEEGDPTTRQLYVMNLNMFPGGANNLVAVNLIDVSMNEGMSDARFFTIGQRGNARYHATSTQIFSAGLESATATLIYDISTSFSGYEITLMQLFKEFNGWPPAQATPNCSRLLFVGIYNSGTQSGKLLQFQVNEHDGTLIYPQPVVYEGFERIKAIAYKKI